MKLAIHLLVKNDQQTVEKTLESILPLNGQIYAGDLGANPETIRICKKYGAKVKRLYLNDDYSKVRNELIAETEEDWIMMIEPWETILHGHDAILSALKKSPTAYRLSVLQSEIITKQVRLWPKKMGLKFINPVYETIIEDGATDLGAYLHATGGRTDQKELVKKWRAAKPLSMEPVYYDACTMLVEKKWTEFLNAAQHYIFQEKKKKMSLTMIRYYCAMVNSYVMKDHQKALEHLVHCIDDKPTMAEFWCLLGDVYYAVNQYDKAAVFYDNAMILGSRRLKNDDWPFEIGKYKEYPTKMIATCEKAMTASRLYSGQPIPPSPNPQS